LVTRDATWGGVRKYDFVAYVTYERSLTDLYLFSVVRCLPAYVDAMKRLQSVYSVEAKTLAQQNNRDKLQIILTKRKLVDREVSISYTAGTQTDVSVHCPVGG